MNKTIVAVAISVVLTVGRSAAASEDEDVMVPVKQFIEGFNKGDAKIAEAGCATETSIIDDFPPHRWQSAGATTAWFKAYDAFAKANNMSEGVVTLEKPKHLDVTGADAYVVVPANFRFKKNAETVSESGVLTIVLYKGGQGWRIAAWSWADN